MSREVSLTELEVAIIGVVYANPQKALKEIAGALGILPEKISRLKRLSEGQFAYENFANRGSPESLIEYHTTEEYPVPKEILECRQREKEFFRIMDAHLIEIQTR